MTVLQIALLFFAAAFLAVVAIYMWYTAVAASPNYHLKSRMRSLAMNISDRRFPDDLRMEIMREMTPLDIYLFRFKLIKNLDGLIDSAGAKGDVKLFLLLILGFAALAFIIGQLLGMELVFSLLLMPLGVILPLIYLILKRQRKIEKFTEQFPDALDMVSRSLKAGHALSGALNLVGRELQEPTADLFKTAYEEQSFGLSMREALEHMGRRMPGTDLMFFVMATNIHREVGGNLGEILESLAHTIRERLRIRRQVRVYTAQARLSGYILAVVPFAMALFLYFAMPGYLEEIFTVPWGIYFVYFALVSQLVGFFVIRKLINIRI